MHAFHSTGYLQSQSMSNNVVSVSDTGLSDVSVGCVVSPLSIIKTQKYYKRILNKTIEGYQNFCDYLHLYFGHESESDLIF